MHIIQKWSNNRLDSTSIYRSPKCQIILDGGQNVCLDCQKYDVKTVYNKKYYSKKAVVDREKDELVDVSDGLHQDISNIISQEKEDLNEWQTLFLQQQNENAKREPGGRRYHPDVVRWAIEMYAKSPAAYEQLRTSGVLTLPSSWTLRRYRNFASSKPGLFKIALLEMDKLPNNQEAYITVDEMKIKENLVYRDGVLVGFIDYGGRKSEVQIATHICMFYIRSFTKHISLPLSWFPTTTTPAYILASMFWECVGICETRNVLINAVVADASATNRKFFDILHGKKYSGVGEFTINNPSRSSKPIYLISDTSHLLKTARNSLYSSKPSGTKYMNKNGKDILWTHLRQLYEIEASTPLKKTRLTYTHMKLGPYNKMKVSLARDTLSRRVAIALRDDIKDSEGTAEFIELFDKWFQVMNCGVTQQIKNVNDPRLQWLQEIFVPYLMDWQKEVDVEHTGEEKRIMARPTLKGLIFSTINAIALVRRLLESGMQYVCLGTLTQDVLEGVFGNLRMMGRGCTNPNVEQVGYGVTTISQRKVIKRKNGANTFSGRKNPWLEVCHDKLPARERSKGKRIRLMK